MESQTPKKDESVKAGLEIEANHIPEGSTEKDADELVHELPDQLPEASEETDVDELVHKQPILNDQEHLEEKDPDELVHERK